MDNKRYTNPQKAYDFLDRWFLGSHCRGQVLDKKVTCVDVSMKDGRPHLATLHWGYVPSEGLNIPATIEEVERQKESFEPGNIGFKVVQLCGKGRETPVSAQEVDFMKRLVQIRR